MFLYHECQNLSAMSEYEVAVLSSHIRHMEVFRNVPEFMNIHARFHPLSIIILINFHVGLQPRNYMYLSSPLV